MNILLIHSYNNYFIKLNTFKFVSILYVNMHLHIVLLFSQFLIFCFYYLLLLLFIIIYLFIYLFIKLLKLLCTYVHS